MKRFPQLFILAFTALIFNACDNLKEDIASSDSVATQEVVQDSSSTVLKKAAPIEIVIEKALLYDQHTLNYTYPYKDTVRRFQWEKIFEGLRIVDSFQQTPSMWAVLQNRNNINGEAPAAHYTTRNAYKNLQDSFGVERRQGIPLYLPSDLKTPERYGIDGSWIKILEMNDSATTVRANVVAIDEVWTIPKKYLRIISDTTLFHKVIFVDRSNQNICTLEKSGEKWLIRSLNPATTGVYNPPYAHPTPLGIFVIQEKKAKMIYLVDGSQKTGGFAPWASRFSNGGYIHGVPVNAPQTATIEFSPTLGTIPRSHMCVRNATSHAEFVYNWAPVNSSLVYVID